MEGLDLPAIRCGERQVKMRRPLFGLEANAQRSDAVRPAKFDAERPFRDDSYAKRFECLDKERFARCVVADSEYDVVEHGFLKCVACTRPDVRAEARSGPTFSDSLAGFLSLP